MASWKIPAAGHLAAFLAFALVGGLSPTMAAADGTGKNRLVGGFFIHDRGPAADRHEDGFDLNLEAQFAAPEWDPWQWIGSPRPHVGATLSLNGETSLLYTGLTYEADLASRLFAAAHGGLAVHDGMLHQDDADRCAAASDCGFGSRVLFRGGLELGVRISEKASVSLLWDHVSHGQVLASENEGIDHVGLRYGIGF
ncbi:acyloxyacyl hydrolase [Shumkonia mesophila]|uniref:acyloxyacyl hydrolase n=1 Tax=Shumkonia mesophila TaxID=2838854 RepID=UPI002934E185|nr:acyloxyacyl hydrolase [Shumkonia mesophila]